MNKIRQLFHDTPARIEMRRWFYTSLLGIIGFFVVLGLVYCSYVLPHGLSKTNTHLILLFLLMAAVGHFSILAFFLSLPALFVAWFFPYKPRWFVASLLMVFMPVLTFFLIDLSVYHSYRFHLNYLFIAMFFSHEGKEIFDFSSFEWFISVIFFVFTLAAFLGWIGLAKKISWHAARLVSYIFLVLSLLLLVNSYWLLVNANQGQGFSGLGQQSQALPFYVQTMEKVYIRDNRAQRWVQNLGHVFFAQPMKADLPLHYPLVPLQCQPAKKLPNILFITIDTWRFDAMNAAVTPHIAKFASQTWQFKNHRSGGNSTQAGIFSLFYALPGTYWSAMLNQHRDPVFVDELNRNRYQFAVYGSAPLKLPAFNKTVFLNVPNLQVETPGNTVNQRDKKITQEFLSFLKTKRYPKEPFFGFLFYDEAHSYCQARDVAEPFSPIIAYCDRIIPTADVDHQPYINRYWNALYQVDQQVAIVLNALQQQKLLKNTIVVITGDHGQEFDDNHQGYWGHASNYTRYQINTPLLIYWPDKKAKIINYDTSHYDIVPTLLQQVFGCTTPKNEYSEGHSLFKPHAENYFLAASYINFAIIEPDLITEVFTDGIQTMDVHAKPVYNAKPDLAAMRAAFEDFQRFYEH